MKEEPKFAPNNHLYSISHSGSQTSMDTQRIVCSQLFFPQKVSAFDMIQRTNSWRSAVTME